MNKFITKGTISAVLGVAAFAASISGKGAFASFLSNPETATLILQVLGGVLTLYAGATDGIKAKTKTPA